MPACRLAAFIREAAPATKQGEFSTVPASVTSRVLSIESFLDKRDFESSLAILNELEEIDGMGDYVLKKQIQWMWSFQAMKENSRSTERTPASLGEEVKKVSVAKPSSKSKTSEETEKAFDEFKKLFGVE